MSVLEVTDLHAGYGRLAVVNGISLRVADREALALLGPNGHGKTTALRCHGAGASARPPSNGSTSCFPRSPGAPRSASAR